MHCDSNAIEASLQDYQSTGSQGALSTFIGLARERARTMIRFNGTTRYLTEPELLAEVDFKLIRAASYFNPGKGSGFTFVSHVILNTLRSSVSRVRRDASRFIELDETVLGETVIDSGRRSREAIEDFTSKLRQGVRSVLTNESELATQRWYIDSFCADGFESRRHSCANACIRAYGISHARSRELYDLTMAEARRVLYDELKDRRTIFPGRLLGTRCAWMTAYAPLLSRDEFTKFAIIMRGLAPYLLLLILDPTHENNHRRDRQATIGRRNLELILYGSSTAKPLFSSETARCLAPTPLKRAYKRS